MAVTDEEIAEFQRAWAAECREWAKILDELSESGETVTAHDVSAEQLRRMNARGEVSVALGKVAREMGTAVARPFLLLQPPVKSKPIDVMVEKLVGLSVPDLVKLRDACDDLISKASGPPAGGCFVPGCTGPCEGEPDRAQEPPPVDAPVRCRIGWAHGKWVCRSSGCGAAGNVVGSTLVDRSGVAISMDDLPPQVHPYDPAETCLFDRKAKP